jgi:hypothetical protein
MRVISSDDNARFMWLGINKSKVIEFSRDIREVLVASKGAGAGGGSSDSSGSDVQTPDVVRVVVLTNRRVNILGVARGRTNVYFYDVNGRQVGALDIAVTNGSPNVPQYDISGIPVTTTVIYRGADKSNPGGFYARACVSTDCRPIPISRDDTDTAMRAGGPSTVINLGASATGGSAIDGSGSGASGSAGR